VQEHLADAKGDAREFDCSAWLKTELANGHRLLAVTVNSDAIWDETLRAEIVRRQAAGQLLLNRPNDLGPPEPPLRVISSEARTRMSDSARSRHLRMRIPVKQEGAA
jgi:hypothetical protein